MSIISTAPYYDKYESNKQYTQLLAVPGRVAQAREITEIQSTMKDIVKSLGDSFLNDGDIIEGCQVIPDKTTKKVRVTPGRIYMKGLVLTFGERDTQDPEKLNPKFIDMKAQGTEYIGIRLKESVVDYRYDSDLLDPALGYENYNQPGMDRLKSELELVKIEDNETMPDNTAIISTLINGEVSVEKQTPNYSSLNETLARRTYDESGSYIVNGLDVRVESNSSDTNKFNVVVESGKAYVHGYELTIPSARRIAVDRSLTSVSTLYENSYASNATYRLTTGPYFKKANSVVVSRVATESITINSSLGASLQHNTAHQILSIKKDNTEVASTSWSFTQNQGVSSYIYWTNTSYPGELVVTYLYKYTCTENTDYKIELNSGTGDYYFSWVNATFTPYVGSTMSINFDKYLARKDTVYIDQDGNIDVLQGIPADYRAEVAPEAPAYTLPLASITSPPGGTITTDDDLSIKVSNVGLTRFTMNDIHKLLRRIRTMEYDQTVISLNSEAKDSSISNKRGIFTDPFIDLSKIGMNFNLSNGTAINSAAPIFDATIDLDSNMVYLPLLTSVADLKYDSTKSTVNKYNRTVTLKKLGERVVLSQMKANKSFLISPYLTYPQSPEVFIDPSMDTWFDDSYIEVPVSLSESKVVSTSSRNVYTSSGSGNASSTRASTSESYTSVGTTVDKLMQEDVIKEESILYIRSREINVTGSNYPPNLDNIKCYFEGVSVSMTPTGSTTSGTATGSVKANASGAFTAKFTIPSKILTGTRVVEFKSDTEIDGYKSSAFTLYQAIGTARTIQRTVTTITTVLQERVTTTEYHTNYYTVYDPDPLAQTFVVDELTLVSGIDIYFESVPTGNAPVTCEIREVSNGNITSKIYGFKTLTANDIRANVSSDSSKATRFSFNDPVLLEANKEYAFVLKSSSQDYRVFVAEIGGTDILSGEMIVSNPYLLGVMMSSSNNSSWTTHQKSDVKFQLISDNYDTSSEIVFGGITDTKGFCRAYLTAESLVFEGTTLNWSYSTDGGTNYQRITPYNMNVIDQLKTTVSLKATMTRDTNIKLSPVLALDSVSMSLDCYENTKASYYYVSNLISGLDDYTKVTVILDTYIPDGTSLGVYVSPSNNNANPYVMKTNQSNPTVRELNNGWRELTYEVTLDSAATQCRIFVKLASNFKYRTPAFRRLRAIMS